MTALALLVFVAGATVAQADAGNNLLKNGDFSGGVAPWTGNVATVSSSSTPAPASGAVVKLGPAWSKVSQTFGAKMGDHVLTVKYALSPGLAFSTRPLDYGTVPRLLGLTNVGAFGSRMGQWCVIFFDTVTFHSSFWRIMPSHGSMTQNFTCQVHFDSDNDQTLVLAFPPGSGSVDLQSISLVSGTSAALSRPKNSSFAGASPSSGP